MYADIILLLPFAGFSKILFAITLLLCTCQTVPRKVLARKELVIDVDATLMKPLIAVITFNHLTAIIRQAADTKHRDLFRASMQLSLSSTRFVACGNVDIFCLVMHCNRCRCGGVIFVSNK